MMLRTKGEQKAYLDGFEMCAECIEKYLSAEGRKQLDCLLSGVRSAIEIEDMESEDTVRNARKVTKKDSHKEWWDSLYKEWSDSTCREEVKPNETDN